MEKNNIVLIGMPGAGKSTVGVVLAKRLGFQFVDSDLVIQESCGKLLHELIEEYGNEGFQNIENRINAELFCTRSVIATGGSVVYGREAMEHLKSIGKIVYLQLPYEELAERLGDLNERGVVLRKGQTLKQLYDERVPLYEQYAELTLRCSKKQLRELASELAEAVRE